MKYVQLFITLKKVFNYRYFSLDVKADAPTILVVGSEGIIPIYPSQYTVNTDNSGYRQLQMSMKARSDIPVCLESQ